MISRWLLDNAQAIFDATKRTKDHLMQFAFLMMLLGVLLAIPGWLAQIWFGMQSVVPAEAIHSEILIFLDDQTDVESRIELEVKLENYEFIKSVTFVSKNDALINLSKEDGLSGIEELIDQNPLPDAFRVRFDTRAGAEAEQTFVDQLRLDDRVQSLKYYPSTRIRYSTLVDTLGFLGIAFSALTIIGVLMAVFLASAADVVDDRQRIELYTLLGASQRYIKRPYLYRASLMGFMSGTVACIVIIMANKFSSEIVVQNLQALNPEFEELPVDNRVIISIYITSVLASWIGAERAVCHRLKLLN